MDSIKCLSKTKINENQLEMHADENYQHYVILAILYFT